MRAARPATLATFLFAVAAVGCGQKSKPPAPPDPDHVGSGHALPKPPPAPPPLEVPALRLPRDLAIDGYDLAIAVDPAQPTLTGTVTISGTFAKPTAVVWLHAEDMTFGKAHATVGGKDVPLEIVSNLAPGKIALRAAEPMAAGSATITIAYTAKLADVETSGTFHEKVGDDWYAFTQHEAIWARRSFPCIDEPDLKVPWRLTLTVPAGQTAVSNALVESDTADGAVHHVKFAATEKLPSYLIAYAVGPFDIVDAGKTRGGAPIRVIALKGRAADAAWAVEATPKIVAGLEDWFGTPYPFPKLDSLAIPSTVGFGAMENPGLITYSERLILVPPTGDEGRRSTYAFVAGHEISHMWFGDLVTPVWWDDLWLNESFASWLPEKVIAKLWPSWVRPEDIVNNRSRALGSDSLTTARRVRQPIEREDDIANAFDGITYGKGAAILRMFEAWVGPDRFRTGVQNYLAAHARGNATAADFVSAIAAQAPELDVAGGFTSFLEQAGAPRLTAKLDCPKDGQARVVLTQNRFVPLGSQNATTPTWHLPVCVLAGIGGKAVRSCTFVSDTETAIDVAGCPAWVWPNADGIGYYRSALDADGWKALRDAGWKKLGTRERLAAAQDLEAGVDSGEVTADVALDLVPTLVAAGDRPMVTLATGIAGGVRDWVPDARRAAYAGWIRKQFGPLARKLGWKPRKGDNLDTKRMREAVVALVADTGQDPTLRRQAVQMAGDWRKIPEEMHVPVLVTAVRAQPPLHDVLAAAFKVETDRPWRLDLAAALGTTLDPARLDAAMAMTIDPAIDIRDSLGILWGALGDARTRPAAQSFVLAHLDELIARMPGEFANSLIGMLAADCDTQKIGEMRDLATKKFAGHLGADRRIAQAFERESQCAARRAATEPVLDQWLSKK